MTRGQIAPCQAQSRVTTAATVGYKVLLSTLEEGTAPKLLVSSCCISVPTLSDIVFEDYTRRVIQNDPSC